MIDIPRSGNTWMLVAVCVLTMVFAACNSPKAAEATTPASTPQQPAASAAASPAAPVPAPAPAPPVSPCDASANPKRCFFSDPFTVSIVNVDHTLGPYHVIRLNIEFRNVGKSPAIVAYQVNSGKAVDNLGNGYAVKAVPTGVPTDYGTKTDARLSLQPGEAHMGAFEAAGYRTEKDPERFNFDMTMDELGAEKPNPVLREHAVFFRDITPAMPGRE